MVVYSIKMSTRARNYEATIIYKLCCLDVDVTEIYVGHTTNFKQRKSTHKCACTCIGNSHYDVYVYQFIRDHGGWENWDMIEVARVECLDTRDAKRIEREYIESLGASLNKQIPTRTQKEWREDNVDHVKESKKIYANVNADRVKKLHKTWSTDNYEHLKEYQKEYRESRKEHFKEYNRQYHAKKKAEKLEAGSI